MTVMGPVDKLSKKVAIPLLVLWLGLALFVWIAPLPEWLGNESVVQYVVKGFLTFGLVVALLMTLSWTFFGDTNLGGKG